MTKPTPITPQPLDDTPKLCLGFRTGEALVLSRDGQTIAVVTYSERHGNGIRLKVAAGLDIQIDRRGRDGQLRKKKEKT